MALLSTARLALLLAAVLAGTAVAAQDVVIRGEVDRADHQSYRELPFEVPAGVRRIDVAFEHDGRGAGTTIDLGLLGPGEGFAERFRGWSGGSRRAFTVADTEASPGYLAGPIAAGRWAVLLGIPNVREGETTAYTARIWFNRPRREADPEHGQAPRFDTPADPGPRWLRGDLHMHSAHSDGSCPNQRGQRMPCPLYLSAMRAAAVGLDFIALTEHNTVSHLGPIRELAPHFAGLVLIPGIEITTFQGHVNLLGIDGPIDFRVGSEAVPDWNAFLRAARERGEFIVVNHPGLPNDERCMGCGWTPRNAVEPGLVDAVEAVNALDVGTSVSGIAHWHSRLDAGERVVGIGASDNHDATLETSVFPRGAIGQPATLVYAESLSEAAILAGLRAGRVAIDVEGRPGRRLDFHASAGARRVPIGGELIVPPGTAVDFEAIAAGVSGGIVELIVDGAVVERRGLESDTEESRARFRWSTTGDRHWARVDVRDADGRLLLIGNPIHLALRPRAPELAR